MFNNERKCKYSQIKNLKKSNIKVNLYRISDTQQISMVYQPKCMYSIQTIKKVGHGSLEGGYN